MKWHQKSIKILGLSPTEEVILSVLDTAKSVQEVAKETSLSRTGINHVLKTLIDKEFVSSLKTGKRLNYIAITQKQLAARLQETIDQINIASENKKGARIRTSRENEFIIHVGTKEIVPAYARIASMHKNERIQGVQHHRSYRHIAEKASPRLLTEFNESIKKNNLILDGMLNAGAYKSYAEEIKVDPKKHNRASIESLEGRMADYHVFPDNFFNYDAEMWIFKSTALIINWKEEVAIEITNANITGFLKDMLEFVKMGSKKIDHNKLMREVMESVHQVV